MALNKIIIFLLGTMIVALCISNYTVGYSLATAKSGVMRCSVLKSNKINCIISNYSSISNSSYVNTTSSENATQVEAVPLHMLQKGFAHERTGQYHSFAGRK